MWSGSAETPPTMRIAMLAPSLQPTERRVAESIAADIESAIERTAQEVADIVGVGRASVIRTAQSLGYEGYPQLRVALAREVSLTGADVTETDGTMLGALRGAVDRFASRLGHTVSALTEEGLDAFVRDIDDAQRLLVAANLHHDLLATLNSLTAERSPGLLSAKLYVGIDQLGDDLGCCQRSAKVMSLENSFFEWCQFIEHDASLMTLFYPAPR